MNVWAWIWLGLGVLVGTVELVAIIRKGEGDTLSENIWKLQQCGGWGKFVRWMIAAFLLWLVVHFASGGAIA